MDDKDSFLHLARPLGPAPVGAQPSTAPLNVVIQPQVSIRCIVCRSIWV
jgi:translation initiation factor 3 subunit F